MIGVLPGVIGTVQAAEVVKLITGVGKPAIGKLFAYDALDFSFKHVQGPPRPDVPRLRRRADDLRAGRLRAVLRHADPRRQLASRSPSVEANLELARAGQDRCSRRSGLDERGLPPGYQAFVEQFEVTPRDLPRRSFRTRANRASLIDCRRADRGRHHEARRGRVHPARGDRREARVVEGPGERKVRRRLPDRHAEQSIRPAFTTGRLQRCAKHGGRHSVVESRRECGWRGLLKRR